MPAHGLFCPQRRGRANKCPIYGWGGVPDLRCHTCSRKRHPPGGSLHPLHRRHVHIVQRDLRLASATGFTRAIKGRAYRRCVRRYVHFGIGSGDLGTFPWTLYPASPSVHLLAVPLSSIMLTLTGALCPMSSPNNVFRPPQGGSFVRGEERHGGPRVSMDNTRLGPRPLPHQQNCEPRAFVGPADQLPRRRLRRRLGLNSPGLVARGHRHLPWAAAGALGPLPGLSGWGKGGWKRSIADTIKVPSELKAGPYLLSWR